MRFLLFLFATSLAAIAADWPQWLGPKRNGHAASGETLTVEAIRQPKVLWKISIGGGFSSPILVKDRIVYMDENGSKEVAHCVDAATGKELWKTEISNRFNDEWGAGPRATPFSDGERVYVQSCDGEFRCLDFKTGKTLWGFNFESHGVKFLGSRAREGTASRRGNSGSGILDGDSVIVPVGSTDKTDGTLRWKSGKDEAAYSSVVVADIAGARQAIFFNAEALTGTDRITGKELWRVPLVTNAKRHTMTPVIDGNRIYVNSHTFGTICFEIERKGAEFAAVEKWRNRDMKINLATPVLLDGHLYSHGPGKEFVCMDAATGKLKWMQEGFGERLSSTVAAGGLLFVLTDSGEGVLVKPGGAKYDELARTQMVGRNWNCPAVADGKLLLRDQRELVCYSAREAAK
jgi:outer membrane protein assembly factor BamB